MTRFTTTRTIAALLLAGGLVAFGAGAPGHDAAAQDAAAPQEAYTEAQLESFADAAIEVNEIATEWQPKIEAAGSPEEQQSMIEEANAEMETAIESGGGITVEQYKEIVEAARRDPALRERIGGILEQKVQGG